MKFSTCPSRTARAAGLAFVVVVGLNGAAHAQIYNYGDIHAPIAPGCAAGTSWTKDAGETRYTCKAPVVIPPFTPGAPTDPTPTFTEVKVVTDCDGIVGGANNNAGRGMGFAYVGQFAGSSQYYQRYYNWQGSGQNRDVPVTITPGSQLRRDGYTGTCAVRN